MFDVSLVELAVIALVALLVLGPEKLPRAARTVGLYMRKARATWYSIRTDIERELAAEDMKRVLKDTEQQLNTTITATPETPVSPEAPAAEAPSSGPLPNNSEIK